MNTLNVENMDQVSGGNLALYAAIATVALAALDFGIGVLEGVEAARGN